MRVNKGRLASCMFALLCIAAATAACTGKHREFVSGTETPGLLPDEADASSAVDVTVARQDGGELGRGGTAISPNVPENGNAPDGTCDDDGNCDCEPGIDCARQCTPGSTLCETATTRIECGVDGLWTTPTSCPYACIGENCGGECSPGSTECVSNTRQRSCGEGGTWLDPVECDAACVAIACGGQCTPNLTRCTSSTSAQICSDQGEWGLAAPCPNACVGDSCAGECAPGQTRCFSETRQQTCSEQGQWQTAIACPNACIGSTCGGECVPGATRCNSSTQMQTCDANGQWSTALACANACVGTTCGGECVPGTRRCSPNTGAPQQCNNGSWESQASCPFACTGNGNCTGECTSGLRRCGPAGVPQLCVAFQWQDQAACPAICTGNGTCAGDCTPGSVATCGQIHGAQGECTNRSLTCSATGTWPGVTQSCTAAGAEVCANQRDDDCDGQIDEDPPCIKFIAVGAGEAHTCGLLSDGTVRCWGANNTSQLGSTGSMSVAAPQPVAGLTGVRQLSVGRRHSCALVAAQGGRPARVLCWGGNNRGQLGDGTTVTRSTPVEVRGAGTAHVTAGYDSSCSIDNGGNAACWGGGIQTFARVDSATPLALGELGRVLDVFNAGTHACALTSQSTVVCTGGNGAGQLGNGTFEPSGAIENVVGVSLARRLFVSQVIHNCVILADGRMQCWGANNRGTLGDGTTLDRSIPGFVPGLNGVSTAALGNSHTCALTQDNNVLCWGDNTRGQLGNGSPSSQSLSPVPISGLSGVRDIAAGWNHVCAILIDGTMRCWGDNTNGQLGNDSVASSTVPVRVIGP